MSYRNSGSSSSVQNWLNPTQETPIETVQPAQVVKSHVNQAYLHENSGSDSDDSLDSGSRHSSSDCGSDPEWNDSVGVKGDLFYVQASNINQPLATAGSGGSKSESPAFKLRAKELKVNENIRKHGDLIEVALELDQTRQNYGRRTLCETLLGLIPAEDSTSDPGVVIRGLTPNGTAMRSEKIKIGDRLIKIDDIEVNMSNLPHVLARLQTPKKVKLILERPKLQCENGQISSGNKPKSFLLHLVKPGLDHVPMRNLQTPIVRGSQLVLYLRGGVSEAASSPPDGVIYQYPAHENKLSSLSGMFITLAHLIKEVTSSTPKSSTLLVEDQLINVSYCLENRDVLVFAAPSEILNSMETVQVVSNATRLLRWQFQSLSRAFGDKENRSALDHFFTVLFHSLLGYDCSISRLFVECIQCVPYYPLTPDLQAQIDTLLSELESGDFGDMSEAFYETKRLYTILGSSYFYKGVLCGNHLPKEDLQDMFLFSQYYELLQLTVEGEVSQIVVWREVFPTRKTMSYSINCDEDANNLDFKAQDGRCFALIVALKHSLLCILMEAGGCTARPANHPPPDPFYVDQARAVLLKLNSTDIITQIQRCYESQLLPEIIPADTVVNKNKDAKKSTATVTTPNAKTNLLTIGRQQGSKQTLNWKDTLGPRSLSHASLLSPGKKFSSPKKSMNDLERQQLLNSSSPPEADLEDRRSRADDFVFRLPSASSSSDADSRTSSEDIYRGLKSKRILSGSFDLSSLHTDLDDIENERGSTNKLLSGQSGALFHYVSLNTSEGVLVSPLEREELLTGAIHSQILKSFQKCAANIHQIFQTMQKPKGNSQNEPLKFNSDRSLVPVKEQGVLFHLNSPPLRTGNINFNKKAAPNISFWVVGRVFMTPEPREVYVCFQDATPQNAVELAFKLSFGTSF